jgi:tetratricopeptide (TPR) repeat protein
MSVRRIAALVVVTLLAVPCVHAMSTEPRSPSPSQATQGMPEARGDASNATSSRQVAEQSYALGYEEVGKARKELEDGKAKKAEKRFQRALEYCEKAVQLDERYHEAWNLLGYTARRLGDYDKAFKAYDRCLSIKPDFAPAREYLGEAWLEKGDVKQARLQLAWLERLGAAEEQKELKARLDAWAVAHPDSAAPAPVTPASTDSTSGGAGTSGQ